MSRRRRDDDVMVPDATFSSYYGRRIVKPAPWDYKIPTYLYTGGLAGGSGLLAAGAQFTGHRVLQRNARFTTMAAVAASGLALVADLGRPERFLNMMRTVKLTSPMSVGTWIFSGFSAFAGLGTASEVVRLGLPLLKPNHADAVNRLLPLADRTASTGTAIFASPLASYTAMLLADTATPTWHAVYKELPFVFVGSAMAAAGGAQLALTPAQETGPARRLAVIGAALELGAHAVMRRRAGLLAEPLHHGLAGRLNAGAQAATWGGLVVTALAGGQRPAGIIGGLALNAGSALTRFSIFHAGIESAKDPKYTVIPQKERKTAAAGA